MYVIVQHRFRNAQVAFSRGEKLIKNEGAPSGVRGLQFGIRLLELVQGAFELRELTGDQREWAP